MIAFMSAEMWLKSEFFYYSIVPVLLVVGLVALLLLLILLLYCSVKTIPFTVVIPQI